MAPRAAALFPPEEPRSRETVRKAVSRVKLSIIKQMSRHVSRGSVGDYQADEQAGVARFSWLLSSR